MDHNAETLAPLKATTHIIDNARLVMRDALVVLVDLITNALDASLNIFIIRVNVWISA